MTYLIYCYQYFVSIYRLSGKPHQVLTGVTLMWDCNSPSPVVDKFCEITFVHMPTLSDAIISSYIQTREPLLVKRDNDFQ